VQSINRGPTTADKTVTNLQIMRYIYVHCEPKNKHFMLHHNFGKLGPMFEIVLSENSSCARPD